MHNAIQPLEPRRLFSTGMTMDLIATHVYHGPAGDDDGYHVIVPNIASPDRTDFSGTARRDIITVSPADNGAVRVNVSGEMWIASAGKLNLFGNGGNDKIHIDLPDSYANWKIIINGGAGDDVIVGSAGAERIIAEDGNDYIVANGGRDTVYGGNGDDSIRGGGSSDLLDGGEGKDTIRGDGGNDNISGGGDIDRLRGCDGNDTLRGGSSKDFIGGERGDDDLFGDGGGDALSGGEDDDQLEGGAGNDNCAGDAGVDVLAGGSGMDSLFGGAGHDYWAAGEFASEHKDVDDEDLAVYSGIQGEVQRAYDYDLWDQPGLTTSMPSASGGLTTIGIATGEQIRGLGPTDTGIFAGQTITGASTIAMYTYAGDANLDGLLDGSDYGFIVQVPGSAGYTNGDFNYDGVIDAGDYGVIDANLNQPPVSG
jgi:RTX calcium-binding nonapeptide repeat (4 copies)